MLAEPSNPRHSVGQPDCSYSLEHSLGYFLIVAFGVIWPIELDSCCKDNHSNLSACATMRFELVPVDALTNELSQLRFVTFVSAAVASFLRASSCAATSFWYRAGTLPRPGPLARFTVTTSPSLQVTTIDSGAAAPFLPPVHGMKGLTRTRLMAKCSGIYYPVLQSPMQSLELQPLSGLQPVTRPRCAVTQSPTSSH